MKGQLVMVLIVLVVLPLGCKSPRYAEAKRQEGMAARRAKAASAQQTVRFGEYEVKPDLNVLQGKTQRRSGDTSMLGTAVHGKLNVLMQFLKTPDSAMRAELRAQGALLGGYVGGNAYYAQVAEGARPADFAAAGAISVVPLAPEWKVSSLLQAGTVPIWAARSGGRVEVVVSWFSNVSASFVERYIAQKGYSLVHVTEVFSNATVILPQSAVLALAAESWVQHVGPVSPPMELNETFEKRRPAALQSR